MVRLEDIREGSIVMVRPDFGMSPAIKVVVEEVEENVKNGLPGFCYKDHWAYLDQIQRVITY